MNLGLFNWIENKELIGELAVIFTLLTLLIFSIIIIRDHHKKKHE
jgi:hypothetical protein